MVESLFYDWNHLTIVVLSGKLVSQTFEPKRESGRPSDLQNKSLSACNKGKILLSIAYPCLPLCEDSREAASDSLYVIAFCTMACFVDS